MNKISEDMKVQMRQKEYIRQRYEAQKVTVSLSLLLASSLTYFAACAGGIAETILNKFCSRLLFSDLIKDFVAQHWALDLITDQVTLTWPLPRRRI